MLKKVIFLIVSLFIISTSTGMVDYSEAADILIKDNNILSELNAVQKHLKIGKSKEDISKYLSKYSKKEIHNESGDAPWVYGISYLYALSKDPFSLKIGDKIKQEEVFGTIIAITKKEYTIKTSKGLTEYVDREVMENDHLYLTNTYLTKRKIGMIVDVFYNINNKVHSATISFVYGPDNNIFRISYLEDGTSRFTINEFKR
ncbi:hypothetical protein [Paenibacillus glacialis]|uniref:Uncharacterized protein n=1 Tax=Paenibacillus glacialis TaxID=494026 RepID=A0A162KCY5_9BACL|nr:hypothetical protein [Paenibacillus glacialis]OAB44828.1 hypothetical protein PGLA_05305 [Paenibacillus glacialis]